MVAWGIFSHSLRMVFSNFARVLQIFAVPFGLAVGLVILLGAPPGGTENLSDQSTIRLLVLVVGFIALALWAVVAWHRYILLAEYPQGWIPTVRTDRMLSYFGHSLLLGLVMIGLFSPVLFVMWPLALGNWVLATILMIVSIVALNIVFFRLSVILPAAAIGKPLAFGSAWKATNGSGGTIPVLVLILWVAQFALQIVLDYLMVVPVIGLVLMALGSTLMALVNISIFTTLYGYYVERRAL